MPSVPPPPDPSPPPDDDRALLDAARAGDDGAFARLLERHDPLLRRLAHALLDGTGTDDVLSESYVKAYRALGRQTDPARPWLLRTTYLACLDEVRRRDRRRRGGPGRLPERPSRSAPTTELRAPDQRAVLLLVDGEGVDETTVAMVLGGSETRVRALLAKARSAPDTDASPDAVEAPDPAEGFWTRLGARLMAERAAPPAPVPRLPDPARPASTGAEHRLPPVAMQKRLPRAARARHRQPDLIEGLASGARRQRPRRRPLAVFGRILAVVAVLAIVAGTIAVVVRMASRAKSPVRGDSVADVGARVATALDAETMSATVTRVVVSPEGARSSATYRMERARDGSYLMTGVDLERAVAYDAPTDTRRERSVGRDPAGAATVEASEQTGLASGPPDASPPDAALPDAELGQALRALRATTDEAAVAEQRKGQDVWRLEADLTGTDGADRPDRVVLVVDRARLAPVVLDFLDGDRTVRSLRFADVVLDGPAVGPFTVDLSADGVVPVDRRHRRMSIEQAAATVGYRPPRPTYLPEGFELARVTARADDGIVSLRYQRGFERVVVTTRTSPVEGDATWEDPFAADRPSPDRIELERGAFRGTPAQRLTTIGSLPSIWGSDGTLAFTVGGDLTADELVRVAESLR